MIDRELFSVLVLKYINDDLNDKEKKELEHILNSDAQARKLFVNEMKLHGSLKVAMKESTALKEQPAAETKKSKQRIEKRFRIPRLVWASLAASIVIVAGALLFNIWQEMQTAGMIRAKLIEASPGIILLRDGKEVPVEINMELYAGDEIETNGKSKAKVKYDEEDTVISITPESKVTLNKDKGKVVVLTEGEVTCRVAAQKPDGKFRVVTPDDFFVKVIGTVFDVRHREGKTRVGVKEGKVEFGKGDIVKEVNSGEQAQTVKWGTEVIISVTKETDVSKMQEPSSDAVFSKLWGKEGEEWT
jgi:ferric-dicitrate binding protein FerR (iron transport regulator)